MSAGSERRRGTGTSPKVRDVEVEFGMMGMLKLARNAWRFPAAKVEFAGSANCTPTLPLGTWLVLTNKKLPAASWPADMPEKLRTSGSKLRLKVRAFSLPL